MILSASRSSAYDKLFHTYLQTVAESEKKAGVELKFDQNNEGKVTEGKVATPTGGIVDLASFRKKKEIGDELARGRKPLYVSHMTGKVTGSPHLKGNESADFGDRLQRIRASLDKINRLMTDLKKMSSSETEGKDLLNSESNGSKKF